MTEFDEIIHRKPLTEQQKNLLTFYRDERKWHQDIQSRRMVPAPLQHKYGKLIRIPPGKAAPWENR
jgi:hypothetical protein